MTTLRDLLVDFQNDTRKAIESTRYNEMPEETDERLTKVLDEYIETIKERIVG